MRIKIGTYSLKIKTYNHKELELDNKYENVSFNLYQKVLFILFIPVLPMEKFWKIKKRDTKEAIPTNAELRTKLNLIALKKKTPLWSYTGSIILFAPIIYFLCSFLFNIGNDQIKKYNKKNEKENEREIVFTQILNKIDTPELNDLYYIKMIEMDPKKNINGKITDYIKRRRKYLDYKLIESSNDSIKLKLIEYPEHYSSGLKIKNEVKTSKEKLKNITSKYNKIDFYETGTEDNPDLEAVFTIEEIERIEK